MTRKENEFEVISTRCEETSFADLYGIDAEALVKHNGEKMFLHVGWIAETADEIQFDVLNKSVFEMFAHSISVDEVSKIIDDGVIYTDYAEAMTTEFADIFRMLLVMVSNKIKENEDFESFEEDEETESPIYPIWYQPSI